MSPATSDLLKRIGSALILAPIILYIVWLGGWAFWGLVFIAFTLCVYEGLFLSVRTRAPLVVAPLVVIYLASGMTYFVLLREMGTMPVIALLIAVWMTDICAYIAGRTIGGPKLAPNISPNKTWAGLVGGMAGSIAAFFAVSRFTNANEDVMHLLIVGAFIAVVGQIGDLLESLLKRQAGAKDSGLIIPGHGGILDRIDALLLCAPAFVLILRGING